MNLMFCERKILDIDENKFLEIIKKCDLIIFGFEDSKINFLGEDYYLIMEKLKNISKTSNVSFILPFYIKNTYRNYFGGAYISKGKIKKFFGECFTNKNIVIDIKNTKIAILFYYDLYSKVGKEISKQVNFVIGIDDEEISDDLVFLENKFFNKLILIEKNLCIKSKILLKNKKEQKIFANIMYKI